MTLSNRRGARRWLAPVAAIVVLNAALTFRNVWPTPAIALTASLSLELAIAMLVLAWVVGRSGAVPRAVVAGLAGLWVALTVGHYVDVMTPALYGRPVNLYWDIRHMRDVAAMLASTTAASILTVATLVLIVAAYAVYRTFGWAFAVVATSMRSSRARHTIAGAAAIVCVLFTAQQMWATLTVPSFATPVSASYAHQVRLLTAEISRHTTIPPPRPIEADLSGIAGADVFVVFVESYGATTYDNPAYSRALEPARTKLVADVAASGRRVVSGFVTSPTFGGSSWLAHISLMTGLEVRDEDTNVQLMRQSRDTLITAFARNGYRTIAAMPGNFYPWPEGAFYGFDDIYDYARIGYNGPQFGWWPVPDQFTLARLDQAEVARTPRKPLFVMMPTTSTHIPFGPIAPYQPDWNRLLGPEPYGKDDVRLALDEEPWPLDLGPSYVKAIAYDLASIGGYLRLRAGRDFVLVVLGDHQPASAISGEDASWDVPVHVIASRPGVLASLEARGFQAGVTPNRTSLGPMHTLLPALLEAFRGVK